MKKFLSSTAYIKRIIKLEDALSKKYYIYKLY